MSWRDPTDREVRQEALRRIVGRDKYPPRSLQRSHDEDFECRVDEMVIKLRARAERRGKNKFQRVDRGERRWERMHRERRCSYCRPAEQSYCYGPRGRIDHQIWNEPLHRLLDFLGESFDFLTKIFRYAFAGGFYAMGFGPHLLFDGYGCRQEALTDLNLVFEFLNELPEKIGMTKISQPHVFKYQGVVPDDWGVTGVVILAESHCSVHTFPNRDGFVTLDIYSCKDFPTHKVINELEAFFQCEGYECKIIERGQNFCRDGL